jgi:hypothetical protein
VPALMALTPFNPNPQTPKAMEIVDRLRRTSPTLEARGSQLPSMGATVTVQGDTISPRSDRPARGCICTLGRTTPATARRVASSFFFFGVFSGSFGLYFRRRCLLVSARCWVGRPCSPTPANRRHARCRSTARGPGGAAVGRVGSSVRAGRVFGATWLVAGSAVRGGARRTAAQQRGSVVRLQASRRTAGSGFGRVGLGRCRPGAVFDADRGTRALRAAGFVSAGRCACCRAGLLVGGTRRA